MSMRMRMTMTITMLMTMTMITTKRIKDSYIKVTNLQKKIFLLT